MNIPADIHFSGIAEPVQVTFEAAVGAYSGVTAAVVTLQLKDAQTGAVAFSAYSDPDREQTYKFPAVEPGRYALIAGVDRNNNAVLCEEGEPCSAETTVVVDCSEVIVAVNLEILQ